MKNYLILFLSLLLTSSAFARIVSSKEGLFIQSGGKLVPLSLLNEMILNNSISQVKLYGEGRVHLISFAKPNESERLYSVDNKGFVYAIEPFSTYQVKAIDEKGFIRFAQAPNKKFFINNHGYFIYQ
jgi:hypothetical protein